MTNWKFRPKLTSKWTPAAGLWLLAGLVIAAWLVITRGAPAAPDSPSVSSDNVVATVNNEPISQREFERVFNNNRSRVYDYFLQKYGATDSPDFWTTPHDGQTPQAYGQQLALTELVKIKVQQILLRQNNLSPDITYGYFLKELAAENARRKQAVNTGQPVYGPVEYSENSYFEYQMQNKVARLKEILFEKDGSPDQAKLQNFYEAVKDQYYKLDDRVKVQKIVLPFGTNQAAARAQAEQLKLRLDRGEDFEKLAFLTTPGLNPSEFEQVFDKTTRRTDSETNPVSKAAALHLPLNRVSELLEEGSSFVLLKCVERQPQGYQAFAEVQPNVRQKYLDDNYDRLVESLVSQAQVRLTLP